MHRAGRSWRRVGPPSPRAHRGWRRAAWARHTRTAWSRPLPATRQRRGREGPHASRCSPAVVGEVRIAPQHCRKHLDTAGGHLDLERSTPVRRRRLTAARRGERLSAEGEEIASPNREEVPAGIDLVHDHVVGTARARDRGPPRRPPGLVDQPDLHARDRAARAGASSFGAIEHHQRTDHQGRALRAAPPRIAEHRWSRVVRACVGGIRAPHPSASGRQDQRCCTERTQPDELHGAPSSGHEPPSVSGSQ